jgi:hypothetical protein
MVEQAAVLVIAEDNERFSCMSRTTCSMSLNVPGRLGVAASAFCTFSGSKAAALVVAAPPMPHVNGHLNSP